MKNTSKKTTGTNIGVETTAAPVETGKTLKTLATEILTAEDAMVDKRPNGELLAEHGLKLVHVRPNRNFRERGMSIAFREVNRNVIEIATAIVHPNDDFCKKTGARLAIENFVAGRTIYVRNYYRGQKNAATKSVCTLFG